MEPEPKLEIKKRGRPHQSVSLGDIYSEAKHLTSNERQLVLNYIVMLTNKAQHEEAPEDENINVNPDEIDKEEFV